MEFHRILLVLSFSFCAAAFPEVWLMAQQNKTCFTSQLNFNLHRRQLQLKAQGINSNFHSVNVYSFKQKETAVSGQQRATVNRGPVMLIKGLIYNI